MTTSFASDIKPMFRDKDRDDMLFAFDLHDHAQVTEHAEDILSELQSGNMPCDGAWPEGDVEKFKTWMEEGMNA
ncbi:MAG: hypothetical protein NVSMB57_08640 [Actinomycetota bacterium]